MKALETIRECDLFALMRVEGGYAMQLGGVPIDRDRNRLPRTTLELDDRMPVMTLDEGLAAFDRLNSSVQRECKRWGCD